MRTNAGFGILEGQRANRRGAGTPTTVLTDSLGISKERLVIQSITTPTPIASPNTPDHTGLEERPVALSRPENAAA